ncbi:30S ribosomal protein S16 [Candidatus Saccharibacteria bacterium]|nr:30S ribosomal protein S16 [Candidatus Saccharibacteria bacterium]
MQRKGRTGHAQFRVIVQDSRFHPSSGRVVAYLGNYDPHSKQSNFDKEKMQSFLTNGAQPSPRVIKLLKAEKMKLPDWVQEPAPKKKAVRNPDKRRSTRPSSAKAMEGKPEETAVAEEAPKAAVETETPVETTEETAEQPAEESRPEAESEPVKEAPVAESQPEPSETPEKPAQ